MAGESQTRSPLVVVAVVALALSGGLFWYLNRGAEDADAPIRVDGLRPSPEPAEDPTADAAPEPSAPSASTPPTAKPRYKKTPRPTVPPLAPALSVDSDVPGAMVFIDREFVGNTPLVTHEVAPGQRQLNVVAEGYDSVSRTITIGDEDVSLAIDFTTVTLDETVDVVHKHRFGSCEGRLEASVTGLRYVTSHTDDAFSLSWDDVGTFGVDYLDKNLRVQEQGGRTWNFTTEAENADPLFVFHRDVEEARERLASD